MSLAKWKGDVLGVVRQYPRGFVVAVAVLLAILVAAYGLFGSKRGTALPADRAAATPQTASSSTTSSVAEPVSPPAPTGIELCGYGPVAIIDGVPQIPPEIDAAAEDVRGEISTELAARSNDRERALGLFLQNGAEASTALIAERRAKGDCRGDDAACKFAAEQAASNAIVQSRRDLVRLATNTSNADAYALAVYRCGVRAIGDPETGDCALLSFAQWARIEPDNVIPWLYLANDAEQRHDQSTLEAALYRAARSKYSDPHWDQIFKLLSSDPVPGRPPAIERSLVVSLLGIGAALPLASFQNLMRYCSVDALRDPNRAQTCGDLAATLIQHGRIDIEVAIGAAILEKVGWATPRLAALHDEGDALRWQMSQVQMPVEDMHLLSCDSLRRFRRELADRAQFGETGQLRRALAASGITTQQAAERWRAANRERMRVRAESANPTK